MKDVLKISTREQEILQLISDGYGSKQIANMLSISPHTVNNHKRNMLDRTKLTSIVQLVKKASMEGLLT